MVLARCRRRLHAICSGSSVFPIVSKCNRKLHANLILVHFIRICLICLLPVRFIGNFKNLIFVCCLWTIPFWQVTCHAITTKQVGDFFCRSSQCSSSVLCGKIYLLFACNVRWVFWIKRWIMMMEQQVGNIFLCKQNFVRDACMLNAWENGQMCAMNWTCSNRTSWGNYNCWGQNGAIIRRKSEMSQIDMHFTGNAFTIDIIHDSTQL